MAKVLFASYIKKSSDIVVRGKFDCGYLLPNLVETVAFDIFVNGIYEPKTFNLLNEIIPPNGYFIDIGANIGAITLPLCKTRPDISVMAIEAAPWIHAYLERNVLDNSVSNVSLINCALFDQDMLEMDFYSPQDKFGKGSLSNAFTNDAIKVKTRTLDSLLQEGNHQRVDVIKVDVEGFEYFVFKGAKELLSKTNGPMIYFEFADWAEKNAGLTPGAAQEILLDYGYTLYLVENNRRKKIEGFLKKGFFNILAVK